MPSSRIRPRFGGRVRPGLLAPVVVAIVLGILGMHGVDAHGVNLHGTMMTHAEATTATLMADHDPATGERADAHATPHSESGGMGGMVMLCVAMLAGAAALLLVLLVRRGRRPKVWAVLQPARRGWRPVPHVWHVGTGPPSVWRFSVIRC